MSLSVILRQSFLCLVSCGFAMMPLVSSCDEKNLFWQRLDKVRRVGDVVLVGITCWAMYKWGSYYDKMYTNAQKGAIGSDETFVPTTSDTTFTDVAGIKEAKEELADIIRFLKYPAYFKRLGAKLPRGVLLVGDPGNGKTLLARAVAGEAECAFFNVSGSEFVEKYVGVGAARVRDLFGQARKHAPAIIFIDELDAIGAARIASDFGAEHNQTLNQLLIEMDGFYSSDTPVIVIAATNRPEILDKALLRPGRFDRKVEVPFPTLEDREQILATHMRTIAVDEATVNLATLARATIGFSGADLAEMVNQAALYATKEPYQTVVKQKHFDAARDTIIMGRAMDSKIMSDYEREVTAYHEAGHALIRILLADADPLYKVTIKPRGFSLGSTHSLPEKDTYMHSREQMISSIKTSLGGRAAELLIFGKLTTGASSDMEQATGIARRMVCHYGMSDKMGPLVYDRHEHHSEATWQAIDEAVKTIIMEAHRDVMSLLEKNKHRLEAIAQELLYEETLDARQVYAIAGLPSPLLGA